ncbi:MAG TPA: galactokinase [Solirubrobacteraceae bacterium]|nr:galactokinase [Solirubrobacteraceae bacterium]
MTAVAAFGPGRVNLIGEHTDYNDGLCLPFAIARGVTVHAEASEDGRVEAHAADLGEEDDFAAADPGRDSEGWRAFVRGTVGELGAAGHAVGGARLRIAGDLPRGSGLSSSAALSTALALALLALAGEEEGDRRELARLCSRVENDWVGAETGLLDQLAALFGQEGHALRLDCRDLSIEPIALDLRGWTLAVAPSGHEHTHAGSGYNERRAECRAACQALGIGSLRDAPPDAPDRLPAPLDRRVRHVLSENARVEAAVRTLRDGDLEALGALLDASHASLRDDYEVSVEAVERTVTRLKDAGAVGARIMGGGFGGSVLALFPRDATAPDDATTVEPAASARVVHVTT